MVPLPYLRLIGALVTVTGQVERLVASSTVSPIRDGNGHAGLAVGERQRAAGRGVVAAGRRRAAGCSSPP